MAKTKFYTVRKGRNPGVYTTWDGCKAQVNGFEGAVFKSFPSKQEADHALIHGWKSAPAKKTYQKEIIAKDDYIKESISVDAACSGNPGEMEFQGVDTDTGAQLFASAVYPVGTNNLGEFLAVVRALQYLDEQQSAIPIYSDSVSAITWVRNKCVKTGLVRNKETEALWQDIDASVEWLQDHNYPNPILKWETKTWGEVKADFGRK